MFTWVSGRVIENGNKIENESVNGIGNSISLNFFPYLGFCCTFVFCNQQEIYSLIA